MTTHYSTRKRTPQAKRETIERKRARRAKYMTIESKGK